MVAVVTCLFNPMNWKSRVDNYARFAASVRTAGCHLYCVELTYDEQKPCCAADVKIDLAGDDRHVLWQREALVSIGLARALADGHEIVAWFDADAVIEPNWGEIAQAAGRCHVDGLVDVGPGQGGRSELHLRRLDETPHSMHRDGEVHTGALDSCHDDADDLAAPVQDRTTGVARVQGAIDWMR